MTSVELHYALRNILVVNDDILAFRKSEAETKWTKLKKLEKIKTRIENAKIAMNQLNVRKIIKISFRKVFV